MCQPVDNHSPLEMAQLAEKLGLAKASKQAKETFFSAITAGVFISIGFLFFLTVTTGSASMPAGMAKLVGGLCFSLGLILCVFCGADLFTSTILTSVPAATRRISLKCMAIHWLIVYIGNFVGALFFVALIWFSGEYLAYNGQWGLNVLNIANQKIHHTFTQAVFLGTLANLMVCLAVWMSYSGRSLLDKMFILMLPIAVFVASGFEHSIANMFMIPLGMAIHSFATPEFWKIVGMNANNFSQLTLGHFIFDNLIPVTIGNIIGGLLVGLTYWAMHLRKNAHQPH